VKHGRLLLAALLGLALANCGRPPASTRPALPSLERPIVALQEKPGQLRIPSSALVQRGGIPGVFVLSTGLATNAAPPVSEARFRMVRPGHREGERLIILAGLHGNETLVLGDLRAVRDGSPIVVVNGTK